MKNNLDVWQPTLVKTMKRIKIFTLSNTHDTTETEKIHFCSNSSQDQNCLSIFFITDHSFKSQISDQNLIKDYAIGW